MDGSSCKGSETILISLLTNGHPRDNQIFNQTNILGLHVSWHDRGDPETRIISVDNDRV